MKKQWNKNSGIQKLIVKHLPTMKTKIILASLFAIIMSSCISSRYKNLPPSDMIDIDQNGSYFQVIRKTNENIDGELIALDSNKIIVLSKALNKCMVVPLNDVKRFKIQYAKPKNYGWTVPMGLVLPFINGAYSIFTFPIHLIVSISVTAAGEKAFTYNDKNITYTELKMFARFPQGVPSNIDITSIK